MPRTAMLIGALVTALASSLGLELFAQDNLPTCVQTDCNCGNKPGNDFKDWQEAQRVLDRFPSDPFDIDRDKDGYACDSYPDAPAAAKSSSPPASPSPVAENPPPAPSPSPVAENPPPPAASPSPVANNPPPPPTTSPNPTTSEESESSSAVPALW